MEANKASITFADGSVRTGETVWSIIREMKMDLEEYHLRRLLKPTEEVWGLITFEAPCGGSDVAAWVKSIEGPIGVDNRGRKDCIEVF